MKKFAFFLTFAVFLMIEPFSLKVNAENKLVERLPEQELQENKTPEAVAYNFVQAILDKDIVKMLEAFHPDFAVQIIEDASSYDCDTSYLMEQISANLFDGKIETLNHGNELAIIYSGEFWGVEDPSYQFRVDTLETEIIAYPDEVLTDTLFSGIEMSPKLQAAYDNFVELYKEEFGYNPFEGGIYDAVVEEEAATIREKIICPQLRDIYEKKLSEGEGLTRLIYHPIQEIGEGMFYMPLYGKVSPGILEKVILVDIVPSASIGIKTYTDIIDDVVAEPLVLTLRQFNGKWQICDIRSENS